MDYQLENKAVIHKCFGKGIITGYDGRYLEAEFKDAGKKCRFQFPSCFYGYLVFEDNDLQKMIEPEVERWKKENQIEKKEELKLRYQKTIQAIEERKLAQEQKKLRLAQRSAEHRALNAASQNDKAK